MGLLTFLVIIFLGVWLAKNLYELKEMNKKQVELLNEIKEQIL